MLVCKWVTAIFQPLKFHSSFSLSSFLSILTPFFPPPSPEVSDRAHLNQPAHSPAGRQRHLAAAPVNSAAAAANNPSMMKVRHTQPSRPIIANDHNPPHPSYNYGFKHMAPALPNNSVLFQSPAVSVLFGFIFLLMGGRSQHENTHRDHNSSTLNSGGRRRQ